MSAPATPSTSTTSSKTGDRRRSITLAAGGLGIALIVALLASRLSGASAPLSLGDPGPVVRLGLPLVRVVNDLGAAVAFGTGVLMCFALTPKAEASWNRALWLFAAAAGVWAVSSSLVLVLSGADVAGLSPTHHGFGEALSAYATTVETGKLAVVGLGFASATAILAGAVRSFFGVAFATAIAGIGFGPTGLAGHAAGPGHEIVASAWWMHALSTGAWFGGLFALLIVRPKLSDNKLAIERYSMIAGIAYAVVVFSGVAGALPRLDGWAALTTPYGLILIAKTILLIVLGVAGWRQRQLLATKAHGFAKLATLEVALMAAAFGLAAALSRTPPPVQEGLNQNATPAEVVTGVPLPPPLTVPRLFTQITPDVLWFAISVALLIGYLVLVRRLHTRGDRWPIGRTISWVLGCAALLYVTCGGLAVYGRTLFSVHMIGHMALSMVVPPFLVFAAPVTLVLRAVAPRRDGTRGLREWLLAITESRFFRVVAHPVVAAAIFSLSLIAFYFTGLFGLALRTHLGHELMMLHFLLAGYLFVFSVVGVDPSPVRLAYPLRLVLLFITMAFHAFFAVSLMSMSTLLQATYFSSVGWGLDLLADQRDGGQVAWAVGDGPTLLLAIVLAVQWARSDERLARQKDRAADRDHDAELVAYNEMLAKLRQRDDQLDRDRH